MDSIETNKKWILQKKIEKIEKDKQKKIEKHKVVLEQKKALALEKLQSDISLSYQKKLAKFQKQQQKQAKDKIKVLKWKTVVKKDHSLARYKKMAEAEFQKYARLLRADLDGYVTCMDTGERRLWNKKVDGWHYYAKSTYPQLAFNIMNVYPITKYWNKKQGQSTWIDRVIQPDALILSWLKDIAENKLLKNQLRDKEYYKNIYLEYKEINKTFKF